VPIELTESVECQASRPALWSFLADTNRLNRCCGRTPVRLQPLAGGDAARYLAEGRDSGFHIEYEERPYEWIEHERYAIERRFRRGPVRFYEFAVRLADRPDGRTTVTLTVRVEPRSRLLSPAVRWGTRRNLVGLVRAVREVDANLAAGRPAKEEHQHPVHRAPLELAAEALRREAPDPTLADRVVTLVAEGSDHELDRMRPFEIADDWQADRRAVLTTFLLGVQAGLLEMSWDIVCPSCRIASERMPTLRELQAEAHCQLCDLRFGLDLDRSVEATFRPARAIRRLDDAQYCSGGPSRTPHVIAQQILALDGELTLAGPSAPGRYRVFVRGGLVSSVEVAPNAPAEASLRIGEQGIEPARVDLAPGGILRLSQRGPERHIKLERVEWASRAATAYHLAMNPSFRRRFSGEVLRPGMLLRVQRIALLFSDLTDSTAFYTRAGDAPAFRLVQEHFELLGKIVERRGGAVVKTIGDSIMASFMDEESAVKAAVEMQEAFPAFVARHPQASDVRLKCGVHAGPCYAVTANGILDYFGQTANIAARLQGTARPGETVLDQELADRASQRGWLNGARVAERFEAVLKGLDAPVRAARIVPQSASPLPGP
jgi:class 3 adenylate cyclase